jgi:hypothetical protein
MPLSSDPDKRVAQLRNLKPNAAATHGAFSEQQLAPLRERYIAELQEAFPSASGAEIALLAHRQAQLAVLAAWMDRRGLFVNRQRGIPYPAVQLHDRIATAFERRRDILAAREQARAAGGGDLHAYIERVYGEDGGS